MCAKEIIIRPDVVSASIGGLVGALAATFGMLFLEKRRDCIECRKQLEQRIQAGHRTMLAVEAQRTFLKVLKETRQRLLGDSTKIEDIPSIDTKWDAIPAIPVDELYFLVGSAKNKNILPALIALQQRFDHLLMTIASCSDERRNLHFAMMTGNASQIKAIAINLKETNESVIEGLGTIFAQYENTQALLETGLKEAIKNFDPIYKVK